MTKAETSRRYYIEIFVSLLFFADLFIRVMPVIPLGILTLAYVAFRCNNWERIFLFLVYYPTAVGTLMSTVGYGGIGGLFKVFGVLLMAIAIVNKKSPLKNGLKAFLPFGIVLALFAISVLTTSGGDAAVSKLYDTFLHGTFFMLSFLVFFNKFHRFDTKRMGVYYIMMSAMMLRLSIIADGIPGPAGIMDVGFLKTQTAGLEIEGFAISYQNLGFLCVQGVGFYLMDLRNRIDFEKILLLLVGSLIVLYSGSRQAIVTAIAILALWFIQLRGGKQQFRWIFAIIGILALYYLTQFLFSDDGLLYSVADQGYVDGSGRGPWMLRGIELFTQNPVTGVGYGRYNIFGEYGTYPHNMIIEILAETGIVGLMSLLIISIYYVSKNTQAFMIVLYLFIALLLRSMVSGGLDDNIIVFTLLFCLPILKLDMMGNALTKR